MKRALLLGGLLTVAATFWLTVGWGPSDGGMLAWQPATGRLRLPARGFVFLPRWSWHRLPGTPLEARVDTSSQEGVRVHVTVRVRPDGGTLALAPAATPQEGLRLLAEESARREVGARPLRCLVAAGAGCPEDAAGRIARFVASAAGASPSTIEVTCEPDPEAVRRYVLSEIAAGLPAPRHKVLVVGLDGLEWRLILPWVRQGRLPNLQRLMRAGCWGRMLTIRPMLSPLIWTTIATGFPPDVHGIADFVEEDPRTGEVVPVTGRSRRVPAVWNLASALGRRVGVVGWWATWPAERIGGVMVSDRLYYTLSDTSQGGGERGDPAGIVSPAGATHTFTALRDRAVREADWSTFRAFMPVSRQRYEDAVAAGQGMSDPVDAFRRILAATRTYFESAAEMARLQPDLLMVYIEGTDEINHVLAPYMAPPVIAVDPREAAVYTAAVPAYFEAVDRWLGTLLELCPTSEYAVLVISDHGTRWGDDRPTGVPATGDETGPMWHRPEAAFVVAGAGVPPRGEVQELRSVYDVAPSITALLGIPADSAWSGRPLPGIAAPPIAAVEYRPLIPPAAYREEGGDATPVDAEFVAKLRSLGYLGGDRAPAGSPETRPAPVGETATTPAGLHHLALVAIDRGDHAEAESLLHRTLERDGAFAPAHSTLAWLYWKTGRYDDADRELWVAVDTGVSLADRLVERSARAYEDQGLTERAAALLLEGTKRLPDAEVLWVHLTGLRLHEGQCREAFALGREAAERFPSSAPAQAFFGLAAACIGDRATARAALTRSLEIAPDQAGVRQALEALGPP